MTWKQIRERIQGCTINKCTINAVIFFPLIATEFLFIYSLQQTICGSARI